MNRLIVLAAALTLAAGAASAQLTLPGATPSASPGGGAQKPAHRHHAHARAASKLAADPDALVGKTLRLNGRNGEMLFARGDDKALRLVKLVLLGEVISHPAQACRIDIVADKPIEAIPKGQPEGLPRFSAEIPACPLSFEVAEGAVLVPAQANACVFSAADCQASPSGLWGPDAAELDKDPKAIEKARAASDRSIQDSLREMEKRDSDAAASLSREESDFAAQRDDVCHDYVAETRLGFCASRLQQARAALLAQRVAAAGPARESPERKRRRRKQAP